MADETILAVDGVRRSFGGVHAVDGAGFDVRRGSITALIGPNGAGKTTLFNVLTGFLPAQAGRVTFDGESVLRRSAHRIAARGMVRTFQLTKTLAAMTVLDNMLIAAQRHPGERLSTLFARPRAGRRREREARERALELLDAVDLSGVASDYAGTLSGGQRKLLELARALMLEPRMLLLDEPMAGVNPTLGRRLLEHMERLRADDGVTFLFIEHDMEVVMKHSDRVVVMAEGRVIAQGDPAAVRADQRVVDAYLGRQREPAG